MLENCNPIQSWKKDFRQSYNKRNFFLRLKKTKLEIFERKRKTPPTRTVY